ncbi:hypothetical protein [Butyrivibrio proteoclasticus]|uniref:hypothetical protein n=1 Tax=Butyrivibrio proteoclasticus TaxID=43305 RepID=UPI00047E0780|nr:hypothetical protein [Butyrivibrio proteoclasticus]
MKLFRKKEKGTNSVKELLKKLKRHDTKVVAIAVVIALALSGGLIYISTPMVATKTSEEFVESERQANQDTVDKLGEIGNYLNELDKVITSNQESLNSINEKTVNGTDNTEITEKVTNLDNKLKEVHTNITGTSSRIENLKTIIEKGDEKSKEQIEKEFKEITAELAIIKTQYDSANQQIKELMDKIKKEIDAGNKELGDKVSQNHKEILNELSSMNKSMESKNTQSLTQFKSEMEALGVSFNKQLETCKNDINNNIDSVNTNVKNTQSSINNNIESVNNSVKSSQKEISSTIEAVNTNVSNNFSTINKSVGDGFGELKTYIDSSKKEINTKLESVFQRVSNGKKKLVSTLLTYGISKKEDATFDDINSGVDELGKRMLDAERKTENAEHSVTPEKIIAGQSVTVNDKEIAGTATSDATASAEHVLAGETAYVNGAMLVGAMPNHGPVNVILGNNQSQTLGPGYYDSITITADFPDRNVRYTHHIHSTETQDETVVDESFSSGADYGSETSSSKGGCFVKEIKGACNGRGVATEIRYGGYYVDADGDGNLDQNIFYVGSCKTCGGTIYADGIGEEGKCTNQRVIGYKAACGRVAGQVIAAEVTY